MRLIRKRDLLLIADQVTVADSALSRLKGLLGRSTIGRNEAFIITPCKIVHMFWMRFSIDALFCNSEHRIVELANNLKPNRVSRLVWRAVYVVELAAGRARELELKVGDSLDLVD